VDTNHFVIQAKKLIDVTGVKTKIELLAIDRNNLPHFKDMSEISYNSILSTAVQIQTSRVNARAEALSMLICDMLRGNIQDKKMGELSSYVYMSGVALHNIPFYVSGGDLPDDIFKKINALDPSGSSKIWGNWCSELAGGFDQKLPTFKGCEDPALKG
jgi:hypothetical protein